MLLEAAAGLIMGLHLAGVSLGTWNGAAGLVLCLLVSASFYGSCVKKGLGQAFIQDVGGTVGSWGGS